MKTLAIVLMAGSGLLVCGCQYDQLDARLTETQGLIGDLASVIDEERNKDITAERRVELDNTAKILAGIQGINEEIKAAAVDPSIIAHKIHGGLDLVGKAGQGTPLGGAAEIGKILIGLLIGGGATQIAAKSKIKSFNKGVEMGKNGHG